MNCIHSVQVYDTEGQDNEYCELYHEQCDCDCDCVDFEDGEPQIITQEDEEDDCYD